jgi:hypothetical protein
MVENHGRGDERTETRRTNEKQLCYYVR